MPTSWTQTGIYSLANIIYGAPFASKQFNTEGNGRPIIRIRDLKDQQFATYTTEVHPKGSGPVRRKRPRANGCLPAASTIRC